MSATLAQLTLSGSVVEPYWSPSLPLPAPQLELALGPAVGTAIRGWPASAREEVCAAVDAFALTRAEPPRLVVSRNMLGVLLPPLALGF